MNSHLHTKEVSGVFLIFDFRQNESETRPGSSQSFKQGDGPVAAWRDKLFVTVLKRRDRVEKMDCCPVMVSDLPVLCSRIDGVVTVVKAEQPNSTCHDLYWGKSLPVHSSVLMSAN